MNTRFILLLIPFICWGVGLSAQENPDTTYWKKDFKVGLNFNQAAFSSNWKGGGVNSIGLTGLLNYKAKYNKGQHSWDNEIDLAYGIVKNQDQSSRKSIDRIFLDTKYGRKFDEKWELFSSANLLTQFTKGYNYDVEFPNGEVKDSVISNLFAPAFLTFAWGFQYQPTEYFNIRFSPLTPRFTFVTDNDLSDLGAYGVDPGENLRSEWLAFQALADFDKEIAKNLNLKWKYLLYINYENLSLDEWDHRLDLILNAKVNKFMSVNLGAIVIYDFDQVDEVQFNQFFNLGLVYEVKNYED
ncbi:DUF3078 domain-containing protein [Fulvivirgaceae bacterium BMA12]|uniref:DUF3078 domain-containing protein n=1 Tax=Agaribacillus aureus TaxID=3051825 RepID=A0ABT8LJA3_9BACT|nr:DUF3078 domain-containing protein [Fulvivirgaceae bacterium BMA12]